MILFERTIRMTSELPDDYKEMLLQIVEEIGGEISFLSTSNSLGRTSQKIVIEYDVKTK